MSDYGNPITHPSQTQTDEFGNPITHPHGQQHQQTGAGMHGTGGGLRRSGSSSSSSSEEDDGQGGRRKKGLKEKIKEKIPGGQKKNDQGYPTTTPGGTTAMGGTNTGTGDYAGQTAEQHHEKKGMMEKIKEKLPGQQKGSTT